MNFEEMEALLDDRYHPDMSSDAYERKVQAVESEKKPLVIYHGNCPDGFTAAFLFHQRYPEWEYYAGVHGEPPPNVRDRTILMLDFSYKLPVMQRLLDKGNQIKVLDHHVSAEKDLAQLLESGAISGTFNVEKSGARLAWEDLNPNQPAPHLVSIVEDYDLWLFAFPNTKFLSAYLRSFPYDFGIWEELMRDFDNSYRFQSLVDQGLAIERKHMKDILELLDNTKRLMVIGGVQVPVANLPYTMASDAGHILAQGQPFAAVYYANSRGQLVFSLRSEDAGMDVSLIAGKYEGGGHRHAAGFTISSLEAL